MSPCCLFICLFGYKSMWLWKCRTLTEMRHILFQGSIQLLYNSIFIENIHNHAKFYDFIQKLERELNDYNNSNELFVLR